MKTRRATEAWHCERPGETIDEGAASVAVEGPGLKGSCGEVEDGHHEATLREAILSDNSSCVKLTASQHRQGSQKRVLEPTEL